MKRTVFFVGIVLVFVLPAASFAMGLELAVGGWRQGPEGDVSYEAVTGTDSLDLERDLNYDNENRFMGRLKFETPLFFPNIYLMATPMEFDGRGRKAVSFKFGDVSFSGNVDFYSKIVLDHYDVALYYGLPFLKTATAGVLNAELGVNVRVVDFKAEVKQDDTGLRETKSMTLPVPMGYLALAIRPFDRIALEAEGRGVAYSGNHYYSLIGRLRVKVFGPLFAAGGYRYEDIKIDEEDVEAEVTFAGPFVEIGFKF